MNHNFFKKVLKNGVTVIFENRKNSGVVSMAIAVKYGGAYEDVSEKGISHFIEHMLYKGTTSRTSKQISQQIEKSGGILNGFTEEEFTAFWCKMPANRLYLGLEVLTDMIKNSIFNQVELDKERKVIFEEMKMRKDSPQIYVYDKIQSLLFNGSLAYDIIGTKKSMNSITREKILKKFRQVYSSNNLIVCIVGEANFEEICEFVEKNFEPSKSNCLFPNFKLKNESKIEKRKGIDQVNMLLAFHSPKASDKNVYASHVLMSLMAGGMSSRLWQEIREKRNMAYAIKGSCNPYKRFGYNSIYVGTSINNFEKVKELILEEFKKIKDLDIKELEEAKEQLIGNSKISREDSQGQMLDLIYNEVYGDASLSYAYENNIKKVNLKQVKDLAKLKNYSFLALIPG